MKEAVEILDLLRDMLSMAKISCIMKHIQKLGRICRGISMLRAAYYGAAEV